MSYVRTLKNNKTQKKSKITNGAFKISLFVITCSVILLIFFTFISVIISGMKIVIADPNINFIDIIFGGKFIVGVAGMGIIVFNTLWMAILVLIIAVPVSVATALLITKLLPKQLSSILIAVVAILAAIPSVVYGAFGYYFLDPVLMDAGIIKERGTLLSIILIVSLMVMPTITMMTTTSLLMVDRNMEDSSDALGATKTQTSIYVTLRAAKPGVIIGSLFALGRVLGEATAISMISQGALFADGVTLNIFNSSLFMSPAIMAALAKEGATWEVTYYILSSLLIITILLVFSLSKWLEHTTSDEVKSKKQYSKISSMYKIQSKLDKEGIDSLSNKEQNLLVLSFKERDYNQQVNYKNSYGITSITSILSKTSLNESIKWEKHKKRKTIIHKSLTIFLSLFGLLSLFMIVFFLFSDGISLLNWDHLTNTGMYKKEIDGSNEIYYGLAIPLFGTFLTTISSLAIALPIGVLIGMYLHIYLKKGTILNNIASFMFQVMTSIPAVIYGTIAIFIFAGTNIDSEMKSFEPILMLSLVILPTIIKQTEEGLRNVKKSQEEGSYSLGATKSYTARRIFLSQAMPAILSAAILASAIVIADSAILITVIGKLSPSSNLDSWIENGGYTLSTRIFYLSTDSGTIISVAAVQEQIKAIGIILMIIILVMAGISEMLKKKKNIQALFMTIGILMSIISVFIITGGIFVMFIIGIILCTIGLIVIPFIEGIRKRI